MTTEDTCPKCGDHQTWRSGELCGWLCGSEGWAKQVRTESVECLRNQLRTARADLGATRAELDAYRRAKQENDERFMLERDATRAEAERYRRALANIRVLPRDDTAPEVFWCAVHRIIESAPSATNEENNG